MVLRRGWEKLREVEKIGGKTKKRGKKRRDGKSRHVGYQRKEEEETLLKEKGDDMGGYHALLKKRVRWGRREGP